MIYLCEGTKAMFRMGYAIMKKMHETILTVKEPAMMVDILKDAGPKVINDSLYIIKWGFKMGLTRYNNSYVDQKGTATVPGMKMDSKVFLFMNNEK